MISISEIVDYATLIVATATAISTIWYTKYTRELVRAEFGPKLYINISLAQSSFWDKEIMSDFYPNGEIIWGKGFCPDSNYIWTMQIVNNGKAPATNIIADYLITTFINEVELEDDGIGVKRYTPKEHKKADNKLKVDYIPPGGKYEEVIMCMGTFPYVECNVQQLKCDEKLFISELTKVAFFQNPDFKRIKDTAHLRSLLGL